MKMTKNKFSSRLFAVLLAGVVTACGGNSGDSVTTDMVKNNASRSESGTREKGPEMTFDTVLQTFGTVVQGEKVRKTYKFTNTGDSELIITSAKGSCGCTVPKYPRNPIKPGESGEIEVIFDSKGKSGRQHKKVYIVANTNPASNIIAIKGHVAGPEGEISAEEGEE